MLYKNCVWFKTEGVIHQFLHFMQKPALCNEIQLFSKDVFTLRLTKKR